MILLDLLKIEYPNNSLGKAVKTFCIFKGHTFEDNISVFAKYKAKELLLVPNIGHKVLHDIQIYLKQNGLDFLDKPEFIPRKKDDKIIWVMGPSERSKESPLFLAGYNYALFKHGLLK